MVTMNLADSHAGIIAEYGIEAQHPDEFVIRLFENSPDAVAGAARAHGESLRNPAKRWRNNWTLNL
jgi:hypothetical protein